MPNTTNRGHRLNWRPDLPDRRDSMYRPRARAAAPGQLAPTMPAMVDLRPLCPPVVDQGKLGSCTANALAGALGFLELQEFKSGNIGSAEFADALGTYVPFSRLFIYWNERALEGDTDQDGGAQIRDGVKTLATIGACGEPLWPYETTAAFTRPPEQCNAEAAQHKISAYARIDNSRLTLLKSCLAEGYPFVFGFTVYSSFDSEATASTGMMRLPTPADECKGGHAVMCVGYNDATSTFIVRNSWGTNWGDGGYFYMPYAYATNANLADDFWTLRR